MFKLFFKIRIHFLCKKYKIKNYTVNSDMSIDVNGNVDMIYSNLNKIPLRFNKVTGYFDCGSQNLTTLNNSPNYVGKSFFCDENKLTSLKYCPSYVGGTFDCSSNNLTALDYCPEYVNMHFVFGHNKIKKRISAGGVFKNCTSFTNDTGLIFKF